MGCDIHLYQEKKVGGVWVTADKWTENPYEDECVKWRITMDDRLYDDRSYRLFAALADVRNGYGFAGVVTGTPIKPICAPRGVPGDCCAEYRVTVESWGADGHSHSWLTLADIDAYDWNLPRQNRGVMRLAEYKRWKASGEAYPEAWSGSVSGGGIVVISEQEARSRTDSENDRIYVEAWWPSLIADDCKHFLDRVRPRLQELERECGAGNARIVFFFDN